MDRGRRVGLLEVLEAQLDSKFGALPAVVVERLRGLPDDLLLSMARQIPSALSLKQLDLEG